MKGKKRLCESGLRTHQSEKNAGCDDSGHKGRGKERKGKGTEGACLQSGFSTSEDFSDENNVQPKNQTTGLRPSLTILPVPLLYGVQLHCMAKDTLPG